MSIRSRNPSVERVEEPQFVHVGVRSKVAVRAVDHRERGAHPSREREEQDAGGDREGRVGVPQIVRAPILESRRADGWLPVALTEVVEVEMAATSAWEEEWRVEPPGRGIESREHSSAERHPPP